jgi:phosphatidate cytidylyltransferase
MTRVLSGAALIAIAVAVVWLAPLAIFEAVAFAVLFAAVEELIGLFTASGIAVPKWPAMAAAMTTLASFSEIISSRELPIEVILMAAVMAMALVVMSAWRDGSAALVTVSTALFPSLYPALSIGAVIAIREAAGSAPLFLLMLAVMVSDTAQYYTGRLVGRRLLAPAISPKKTIEGAIGGFLFGALVFTWAGAWWLPMVPPGVRLLLGIGIVASGIAGDLFESMLKRSAGVKDSAAVIPGHGGILDRIDALLFAAPFYYVVLKYV